MPTYAYACKECSHAFDIYQSFEDDALTACPECSGVLRKKFGNVGVAFKGAGFYRNDARGGSSDSAGASSEKSDSASGSSASSSGSETSSGGSSSSSSASSSAAATAS
ncbi:FmdB family zinc ribbon protein [Nesterenkonia sp. NBAIMH1]|uniref:FmdB family zinc ribbon protein n=1 Tax=Nesterenkonia sp. NBAIMH1 TaxID=2600320 RepID=UPI0011B45521|nr:FmdB family zinc ribbon protein [Nesterenkonia sp. NBAIMH1]